jgi:hypothetical protein
MSPGASVTFNIAADSSAGRVWGRTNCRSTNSGFRCDTGDCGGLQCAGRGGPDDTTLFEWTFVNGGNDNYDISLVDAYNIPMSVVPKNPSCKSASCSISNLNAWCPGVLQKRSNGQVVSCRSACAVFNTDDYCCRKSFNDPNKCKASSFANQFKAACPLAYSYAYNDAQALLACKNTGGFTINFC